MTKEEVNALSFDELYRLAEEVCTADGCNNLAADGVIYCERCLHGAPRRASDEQIWAKRRLRQIQRVTAK